MMRATSSNDFPASAAAPPHLYTANVPAIPRRKSFSSGFADAMSSVT